MLKLSPSQVHGSGQFGIYFRLSKSEGVKIYKEAGYATSKLNLNTKKNQRIIQEATIGILADGATKELQVVKYKNKFYLAIVQKHVTGRFGTYKETLKAKKDLNLKNIVHSDLHEHNLIKAKNKLFVLDFDPNYSYYVGKKSTYYTVKNKLIKNLKNNK